MQEHKEITHNEITLSSPLQRWCLWVMSYAVHDARCYLFSHILPEGSTDSLSPCGLNLHEILLSAHMFQKLFFLHLVTVLFCKD